MENISPNIQPTMPSSCNLSDQYCEILRSLLFEIQNLFGLTADSISIQFKHEYLEKILDSIEELGAWINSNVSGAQRPINSSQDKLISYLCHILKNGVNIKDRVADQPQNLEKIVTLILEGDIAMLSEPKIRFQDILEIIHLIVMNDKIRACFNRSVENLDKQTQYQEKYKRFSSITKTQILIINLLTPYFKGYLNDLKFEELILTLIKTLSLEELVNKIQTMVPKDQFIQLRNEILGNMALKRAIKYIKKCQKDMEEEKKIESKMCEMKQKLLNYLREISPDSLDELKKFIYEDLPKDLHRGHIINALEPLIIPKHFAAVRNKINDDKEIKSLTDEISSSLLTLEQIKLESQIQSSFNKYELAEKEEERLDIVLQKLIHECDLEQALTYVNDSIWESLYKKITNDKELIKSVGELKQLNQNIKERRSPEFELHNQLTNCVNYALKGKFGNKVSPESLIEILKTTGSSEFALLRVQNDVAPLIYNQIKEFLPKEESINNILQKLKEEWLRQCSNDTYTLSIANTILQEVSNNNLQIKLIALRETISKLLSSGLDAQSLLKSFTEHIAKQNIELSMEQLEKVKTEALPRLPKDFKDYYQVKRILENILRSLEVDDELLLIDSAMKLYQTNSLDETINVIESRIPELQSRILEAIYQDLELEEVIFGKLEKNSDSVLSSDIMKMIKEQIEQLAEDYNMQINIKHKLFILQNISTVGFDENWDLTRFEELERSQMEEIFKDLSVNEDLKGMISILRESFDDILLKQELEKDLTAGIDIRSDELEILIQAILEKGYFDALLEKISNSLNKNSAIKCLEWIESLLQAKPIYKRKELYSKRFTAWENKVDELMAIIMSQELDSADSDSGTMLDIIETIKSEILEREELKDIKLMLAKMRPYLESTGLESSIEILFHKDSTTFKVSQDISKAELEKDKDFASLLRYNLRFGFQFRGLTEYFNAHLLKDPKNLEDVFQDYKQYYQMNHLPIDRPESLDYLALTAHDDQLLNLIISLEETKKMYLGTRDTEFLVQIERDIAPKVYAKSEKLYDLWIANNKALDIKRAEVPFSDYVLYPKVQLQKSLELVSRIKLPKLDLRSFNQVTFRIYQEEQEQLIRNWISNLEDFQNFQNLLPIYFNLLKRGEDWRTFVDKVSSSMVENNLSTKFGFFDKKFLFYLLFTAGDTELQAKTLELFGRYNPIPLRYPKWNDLVNNPETMKYAFNDLIYYIMQPSLGIMSLALGKRASLPIGKSEILNKVFKKNFSINESANPFHVNTIDVDFDCSFRPYRNFCIADAHGNFPFGELSHYCEMFKILIVHIHYEDLIENRITDDDLLKLANQNLRWKESILVLIRDIPNDNDTCIEKDENQLISLCPQLKNLSTYLSEGTFQLVGLTKLTELVSNNLTAVMQKLQTLILGTIQPFRDEITITKNSFVRLMQRWHNNSSVISVDNSVSTAMREIEKYEKDSDFFDEKIFPYRDHLAELRKVESILRNATTENELMEAQWRHSALQKKLENGKPTRILEIFCNLLNQEESHLVIMELASQIKDFVSRKTKYYKQIKEDLMKSISFNELNDKNKEGEELEQHKEMLQAQKEELERINDKLFKKSLSIEVIWRELMAVYTYNPKTAEHLLKFDFIISKVQEFLEKGESFELVDGDNLQFNENLLINLMKKIKGKMFNICVLGPQSSGKSTLLNYLFGSQFLSSVGRCTRGAYLSLLTVPNNSHYQYIMILDTEGLQSTEKNDKEFDRRVALFCLAVSHITIVNVKGDLHSQMKCLLESSALSLHSLNKNKIKKPSIYFVFNQNPPTKDKSPFMTQISSMMNTILSVNPEAGDAAEIFRSNPDKLHVLSFAFSTMKEEKNLNKNIWQDWEYILPESSFASECAKLAADINGEMDKLMKDSSQSYSQQTFYQFKDWLEMAIQVWKSISIFPGLVEFSRVESYKQDKELVQHCENIIQKKQSRLNGEEIVQEYFGSTLGCKDPKKLIVLIEKSELLTNIGKIKDHYTIIQNQMNSELAAVKEAEKYEYELSKKHEKIMTGIIQFSEQEAIFVLKREMLKVLSEAQNAPNEWGVGELYLKVFENDYILDFENHQEILFGVISGLYHRFVCFPHLGTAYTKLFQQELSNIYVEKNAAWDDFEPFLKSFKKELLLGDNEIYCWNDTNPNFAQNYTKKLEEKCNFVNLTKACPVSLKIEHVETQLMENNFEVDQLISRDSFLEVFKDIPILSVEKKIDPEIQNPKQIIKDFLDANKNYTILEPCQVIIKGVCEFDVDEQWKNMDPQNVKITINQNELQFILKKETDWDKLFFDIYKRTTEEIIKFKTLQKQHGNKDQDHSCLYISSVLLDLVKSVFDQVNKIIEVYNQDISRISQTLDMYGRGIVHLFATLILWKLLCHQEQAVLIDLIRKIDEAQM